MSTISDIAPRRAGAEAILHAIGSALLRWWAAYMVRRIERLAISRLQAMTDRQLDDIGIARSQIAFAVKCERDSTNSRRA